MLLRTSYGDRTSPVLRGAWVLDKLNGTPPTPPPPDTATDLSQKAGEAPKTVRARLEQHRAKASCRMCHGVIDPTGLALENFDAIGQWRTQDAQANAPIDASTVLPNGIPINGVVELRAQLAGHPETFARTVAERMMMYGINRQLEYFDMPQIRKIVRTAAKDNYQVSSLILGIVNSDSFRRQGAAATAKPAAEAQPQGSGINSSDVSGENMFITKRHIPRRALLKAAGVTLGLPFLDAMVPASTALAQTAAVPKLRTGFFYIPHGAIMSNTKFGPAADKWTPSGAGAISGSARFWRRSSHTRSMFRLSAIWRMRQPRARFIRSRRPPGSAPPVPTPAVPAPICPRLSIR